MHVRPAVLLAAGLIATSCSAGASGGDAPPRTMTGADVAFDGLVAGARVVLAARQGSYACTAVASEVAAADREDGWVGGCNRYAASDQVLGPATGIVQVRPGVWVVANADSEGTLVSTTIWTEAGATLAFEPIAGGRAIVGSVAGRITCVEVTSRRYAKLQAWPPFDLSDDRAVDSSGCPPYSAR